METHTVTAALFVKKNLIKAHSEDSMLIPILVKKNIIKDNYQVLRSVVAP